MVASWGIYFRVEFQLLSMLRRKWMALEHAMLRTFLFSATYTKTARDMLQGLYGDPGGEWREFHSQRLRPEPSYFLKHFPHGAGSGTGSGSPVPGPVSSPLPTRDDAVIECLLRVARPAILYTTEVKEAKRFASVLESMGFARIGCFNGETPPQERRRLIREWRGGNIDLMVATSAFGLGVDKQDVRVVLHACLPEDMDRYYQEVGRSGRDGGASVSILLATPRDVEVAGSMGPKLLRPETIQKRWEGLWSTAVPVGSADAPNEFDLRVDARPNYLFGARTYKEHVRWNKRLLLQLQRAGQLSLVGMRFEEADPETPLQERTEWVRVRLTFPPAVGDVAQRIEKVRTGELQRIHEGFERISAFLSRPSKCIAQELALVYGREDTIRVCGGCPECRRTGKAPVTSATCAPLAFPRSVPGHPNLLTVSGAPSLGVPGGVEAWKSALRSLVAKNGVRRFLVKPKDHEWIASVFKQADPDARWWYRIDLLDGAPLNANPDETIIVLHGTREDPFGIQMRIGGMLCHVFDASCRLLDADGRYPLESAGV